MSSGANENMTTVVTIPAVLDDFSFEGVTSQLKSHGPNEPLVIDARQCTFATPFGMTALLTIAQSRAEKPALLLPVAADTLRLWTRFGFMRQAESVYAISGAVPEVPLGSTNSLFIEVARLAKDAGALNVVERTKERLVGIFTNTLKLESPLATGLAADLSAWCRAVIGNSYHGGWVMAQVYQFKMSAGGNNVAVISISDAVGKKEPGDSLNAFRRYVPRLDAKFVWRSDTMRVALLPGWDDDVARSDNLAPFHGTQLLVTVPGRITTGT